MRIIFVTLLLVLSTRGCHCVQIVDPLDKADSLEEAFERWDWRRGEPKFWETYPQFRPQYDMMVDEYRKVWNEHIIGFPHRKAQRA